MERDDWLDCEDDEIEPRDEEADRWLMLQPPAEGDILTPKDEGGDEFEKVLNDDLTPRDRKAVAPAGAGKYALAIAAARKLNPKQRKFVRALIQTAGNIAEACQLFNARSLVQVTHGQAQGWIRNPDYRLVYETGRDYHLNSVGVDPSAVLAKAVRVHDDAMLPAPILHKGRATGFYERDRGSAMRAIEFLGKANGMTREDNSTRVTVQVINLSSREKKAQTFDG